jgi:hypothetical protein
MKPNEKIIAEAIRVEVDEYSGDMFLVFKVKDQKLKQQIISTWTDDIEYRLINKKLVKD